VWIIDVARGTSSPVTTAGQNSMPVWAPDDQRIAYRSSTGGPLNLFLARADGTSPAQRLTTSDQNQSPSSW
jgi:Tol biopolymer transport system component